MSAYNLRGGTLGLGGDEQQPVARALRHDRHPGPPHPGHQRPVRYEQGHHHEDRRQVGTPSGILSSYIHPTTYRRSWRRWSRAGWGRSSVKSRRSLCSAVARTPTWCWLASDVLYRENTFTHVRIKVEEAASSPPSRLTLY